MRRALVFLMVLIGAGIGLPPLYYSAVGEDRPPLPPPGDAVRLADGTKVNVIESGRGPAIVLSHGLPGTAYDWDLLRNRLAPLGYRVIAYDRVGFGHSDVRKEGEPHTIDENARDLIDLLEALDVENVTVVGWSYGGATAMRAAALDPSRMGRIVLIGSGPPPGDSEPPGAVGRAIFGAVVAWVRSVPPASRAMTTAISRNAYSDQPMPDWWVPLVRANLTRPGTQRAFAQEPADFDADVLQPDAVTLPVLLVHGTDDRLVSHDKTRALWPSSERVQWISLEDGSHMIPITHPDVVAGHISSFASGRPAP